MIGWPLSMLIFAVVFLFMFRGEISSFIDRIKSVGREGISTTGHSPEVQHEENRNSTVDDLMRVGDSIVLSEVERLIYNDLSNKGLEITGDSIKVLVRHLAATQLALDYEHIHNLIFGTQINLLKRLNEVVGQGRSGDYMANFLVEVKAIFPELADWTLDKYLTFLSTNNLITINEGGYHITNKGVDYLTWISRTGHSEDRDI